ncbi:MAG: cation:proton antiporter [Thermoplasmata archaeon]|nr:cation:proton antiporter [Thermoplasmata archaeon]
MTLEAVQVIQDLAIVMIVALAMALLSYKLRQPLILGYVVAGMIVGPYTPPVNLLSHPDILNLFAEIGIVFLLFAVGLEYPIARLRSVGRRAIVIALAESLGTFAAGTIVALGLGLSEFNSLFVGLAVSVTSTILLSQALEEMGVVRGSDAGVILGITVVEDVVVVSALAILQSVASTGHLSVLGILISLGLVIAFLVGAIVLGSRTVPRLIDLVAATGRTDLLLVATLGVAFGLSILSNLIGISVATGAFLGGVLVAESRHQDLARSRFAPLKDLFAAIFFVSMGALMDIELLPSILFLLIVLIATAFVAKWLTTYLAARATDLPRATSTRTAWGLSAAGGELSLVVAKGGLDVGATTAVVLPLVGAFSIVMTFLRPYFLRYGWRAGESPAPPSSID